MAIVTVDSKNVRITVAGKVLDPVGYASANRPTSGTWTATVTVTAVDDTALMDFACRLGMAARGYAMAPPRKRPRRIAAKIRARFGVAHHRDYHRELVRWMNTVAIGVIPREVG